VYKEHLLTIGEVSKIKKISIKSLRYYEHIGILVPVKINPENGYRYYSADQLLAIDMIKFLASMDIPLKEWHTYIHREGGDKNQSAALDKSIYSGGFHLRELITDSKNVVYEQLQMLKSRLNRLELAERGLKDHEKYQNCEGWYMRQIAARNLLCYPVDEPASAIDFHRKLSILFELAETYKVTANYPSGMLMDYSPEKQTFYVWLEIYERLEGHPFYRYLPEHTYRCIRRPPKSILRVAAEEPEYFIKHPFATIVEADCITSPVEFKAYPTELQFYFPE